MNMSCAYLKVVMSHKGPAQLDPRICASLTRPRSGACQWLDLWTLLSCYFYAPDQGVWLALQSSHLWAVPLGVMPLTFWLVYRLFLLKCFYWWYRTMVFALCPFPPCCELFYTETGSDILNYPELVTSKTYLAGFNDNYSRVFVASFFLLFLWINTFKLYLKWGEITSERKSSTHNNFLLAIVSLLQKMTVGKRMSRSD